MKDPIDAGMLEMLASKICHDLISPIGAIHNGIEFMNDMGPNAGPEAAELISFSAGQASAKLQAFRLAYGAGGADPNLKPEDIYKTIQLLVGSEKKLSQNWDPHANLGDIASKKGFCKILACAFLLAIEALPKGGKLSAASGNGASVSIRAEGADAGLRGNSEKALNLEISREDLEPACIHACMTGLLARHYGFKITAAEKGPGYAVFKVAAA